MPVVSQAQRRFMYATAEGKTDTPKSVGREFVQASRGLTGLPERKSTTKEVGKRLLQRRG